MYFYLNYIMGKKQQHHKIEWFDKLRLNSWEVEILIVGFVLVMLFQVPETLSFKLSELMNSVALDTKTSFFYMMGQALSLISLQIPPTIYLICSLAISLLLMS